VARIDFKGITKSFGDTSVLTELNISIADGEFFSFVGPSGCGKSTILNLIAGIEPPTRGALYFDGKPVHDLAPGRRDVAMVFQNYALYPHYTVAENLAFPLTIKRWNQAAIAAEVERVAQMLGLDGLLHRKPKELSGGQRQRVALGRALIRRPRVFLMDEPLSNLDAQLRLEMREELKRLHAAQGITTVYVTHDQEEALALSQRIAVLANGAVQQCGTPGAIYESPINLYVARFIGSPPINTLPPKLLAGIMDVARLTVAGDGRNLVLGVRPADIRAWPHAGENRIAGTATLVELTGGDLWVVGDFNGQRIKGRASPDVRIETGAPVYFEIPRDRILVFDQTSGVRLN
jgi:multiple sugar transport system ATP-binding protein